MVLFLVCSTGSISFTSIKYFCLDVKKKTSFVQLIFVSGVAYSKHIVHVYSYRVGDDLRNHLEVFIL